MLGKIGLEEHFAIPETLLDSAGFVPGEYWKELEHRLLDIQERRLREMDAHGMAMMVLSLNAPAVQAIQNCKKAIEIAQRANDFLAEQVSRRSDRFQAFAALPLQDPEAATRELERCIRDLKFKGALVNGFSQIDTPENVVYLDDARYNSFWAMVESLDAPFYLHPRNPIEGWAQIYTNHPWLLGPTWAFGNETAVHSLRLIASGLFERHPRLKIIIGHMGEGLPVSLWRCDHRNAWVQTPKAHSSVLGFGDTFRRNFWITTSGNFRTQALVHAISELSADRILFSTDWPFENVDHAANWFDTALISEADRQKIGRTNAISILKLNL
jgi:gamma-resorcylate decarboxylase